MTAPIVIRNLLDVARAKSALPWEDYGDQGREGARIHRLYRMPDDGPLAAIVQFLPGARAKAHIHPGHENILVLEGGFEDETGRYRAGDLVSYPPGSRHRWVSDEGALLYVVWDRPTVLDESDEA